MSCALVPTLASSTHHSLPRRECRLLPPCTGRCLHGRRRRRAAEWRERREVVHPRRDLGLHSTVTVGLWRLQNGLVQHGPSRRVGESARGVGGADHKKQAWAAVWVVVVCEAFRLQAFHLPHWHQTRPEICQLHWSQSAKPPACLPRANNFSSAMLLVQELTNAPKMLSHDWLMPKLQP